MNKPSVLKQKKGHTPGLDFSKPGITCLLELIADCCFKWSHIKQALSQLWVNGKYLCSS